MLINGDDVVGEYSASSPGGIRRAPYAGYPLTYGDVTGAEVHDDGEIYAAVVWRMIELFGDRRDDLFDYVVDGMNFTPSKPAYEDMRDGILASVANGSTPSDCDSGLAGVRAVRHWRRRARRCDRQDGDDHRVVRRPGELRCAVRF